MVGANLKEAELITEFTQKVHDFVGKIDAAYFGIVV